jgi:UDP-N-acetylglucosamine:LPS N-acetylglucosamine transferase
LLVQGKIENNQTVKVENGIKIYNYLLSSELEQEINQSEIVICRSGYSSIMDLAVLRKKVFFIPTKNQTEQEYLASYLETKAIAPFCEEENFNLNCLDEVKYFNGVSVKESKLDKDLLSLF